MGRGLGRAWLSILQKPRLKNPLTYAREIGKRVVTSGWRALTEVPTSLVIQLRKPLVSKPIVRQPDKHACWDSQMRNCRPEPEEWSQDGEGISSGYPLLYSPGFFPPHSCNLSPFFLRDDVFLGLLRLVFILQGHLTVNECFRGFVGFFSEARKNLSPKGAKIEQFQDLPPGLKFASKNENLKRATHQGRIQKVKIKFSKRD